MEAKHTGDHDSEIHERATGLMVFGALLLLASLLIMAIVPISLRGGSYFIVKLVAGMVAFSAVTITYGATRRAKMHRKWNEAGAAKAVGAGK